MRILGRALHILGALGLGDGVRDGTFVDVGANIGTTTVTAMCSHGFARAVSCEPEPHNQQLLELNLVANDLERDVEICRAAVADRDGTVELLVNKVRSGGHEVHYSGQPVPDGSKAHAVIEVGQVALDSLASDGMLDSGNVTFLWIDAQGHEGHVLRGASSLTERGVPVVAEFFPEMMDRHGGLGYFMEVASERYTHYVHLHRARGKAAARFDVTPIAELARETERLLGGARVTDILLVSNPRSRPTHGGGPGRAIESQDRARNGYAERTLRDPATIPAPERRSFLRKAAAVTHLVAAEIEGATFLVRTSADAPERPVFVQRSHPRLERLDAVMAALDGLGIGAAARKRTFVEVRAGTGIATVAALRWHGFARALACEDDQSAYQVLRTSVAVNGLRDRVRALPVRLGGGEEVRLDDLVQRGLIDAGDAGLVWIEGPGPEHIVEGARTLLEAGPPLMLGLESGTTLDPLLEDGLVTTYTHFACIERKVSLAAPDGLLPMASLEAVVSDLATRSQKITYLLAVNELTSLS
jgi:FkbM family methyltransferase